MSALHKEDRVSLIVNPYQLRKMADDMERRMAKVSVGERVWTETFRGDGIQLELIADQDWFQRRADGIPNWDAMHPGPDALSRFAIIENEAREFPKTYSGAGWHAAYRIWKAVVDRGEGILDVGPYEDVPGVDFSDLDLSGFLYGWAVNAVRRMVGKAPGPNPAIVTVGGPQHAVPALGSPEDDMRWQLGG